jgi:hypothetical protein
LWVLVSPLPVGPCGLSNSKIFKAQTVVSAKADADDPTLIQLATAQEAEIVALYKLTLNHHWTRGSSGLALQV